MSLKIKFVLTLLLFGCGKIFGQEVSKIVTNISVLGNKKTRTENIYRELDFRVGDTILAAEQTQRLEKNRLLLMSTGLFSEVEIFSVVETEANDTATGLNVRIQVQEAWFIYPFFNIELADRNFNVWWVEQNHALNRLNYVFQVTHRNLTGRKDLLKTYLQLGYEPKFQLSYTLPFFNEAQTLGLNGDIFYARAREWGLQTTENKLVFTNNEDTTIIQRFRTSVGLRHQPKVYFWQEINLFFHQNNISEFAAAVNPNFFLEQKTSQRYFAFTYRFIIDRRDFRPYPLNGYYLSTLLTKEGLGIFNGLNTFHASPMVAFYQTFGKKWSFEGIAKGRYAFFRKEQPYFNLRALGYRQDYMRGYEYYVIDGLDFGVMQLSLRYELLNKNFDLNKKAPNTVTFPFRIYAKAFHDEGYVRNPFNNDPSNDLVNRHLWSAGLGFDFVIYNDFVLQIEYTLNNLKEHSPYVHLKLPF